MSNTPKIIYTLTDEAPFLATQSLLPIVDAFTATAGMNLCFDNPNWTAKLFSCFNSLFYRKSRNTARYINAELS